MYYAAVCLLASFVGLALGHSHMTNFVVDGASYEGFNPRSPTLRDLAAWRTSVKNDGWVGTASYGKPDIVCHVNATNAHAHAPVAAGDTIGFQWQGWPESHHGPILTYLAYCGKEEGSCEVADKTKMNFFAIDKVGLVDPTVNATSFATAWGVWASDILIQNNATWTVKIPTKVVSGHYVLRHEIIALHYVGRPGQGAQHYPQCINIEVVDGGDDEPGGILGIDLYQPAEEGLVYNISQSPTGTYNIPGPTVYAGAATFMAQTGIIVKSSATAKGVATVSSGVPEESRVPGQRNSVQQVSRSLTKAMPAAGPWCGG